MERKRAKKATPRQIDMMIDFIENNKEMVSGKLTYKFTATERDRRWEELADILNSDGLGPQKDSQKWRRTWINFKSEIKGKMEDIKKSQKATGGGVAVEDLSPVFDRMSRLINPVSVTGEEEVPEIGLRNQDFALVYPVEISHVVDPDDTTEERERNAQSNDVTASEAPFFSTPSPEVQKKRLNLRTCFAREQTTKTGPAASKRLKYIHCDKLEFLKSSVSQHPTEINIKSEVESDNAESNEEPVIAMRPPEQQPNNAGRSNPNVTNYQEAHSSTSYEDLDEDKNFALSLVPTLKSLTEDERFQAKIEILQILRKIKANRMTAFQ